VCTVYPRLRVSVEAEDIVGVVVVFGPYVWIRAALFYAFAFIGDTVLFGCRRESRFVVHEKRFFSFLLVELKGAGSLVCYGESEVQE